MYSRLRLFGLSIHDLTRRSTSFRFPGRQSRNSFNSRPHKEVDHYMKGGAGYVTSFNSRPHKEVDEQWAQSLSGEKSFNSRPHKEVDEVYPEIAPYLFLFQFTTSQGGRHNKKTKSAWSVPFNSRPHKEVDHGSSQCYQSHASFNSRPHKEVDQHWHTNANGVSLSIHDLTRRSTNVV